MNNYEYIIAGLPVLQSDFRGELDFAGEIDFIREQLSDKDRAQLDQLLSGFDGGNLTEDFYKAALASRNSFIRKWFELDLNVRNCKVEYLNKALGRAEGTDIMAVEGLKEEFGKKQEVMDIFSGSDILAKERGLDDFLWKEIEDYTVMEVFSLDLILAFVVKLQIVARWLKLDPEKGRELFAALVEEIRNNKKEIQ